MANQHCASRLSAATDNSPAAMALQLRYMYWLWILCQSVLLTSKGRIPVKTVLATALHIVFSSIKQAVLHVRHIVKVHVWTLAKAKLQRSW